jgi:hypothetical protein
MTTAFASDPGQGRPPPQYEPALAALAGAADILSAADLADVADDDIARVMGELTILGCRIDALRIDTAAAARDRGILARNGTRSLAGWLRADPRTADQAWQIATLAARRSQMPVITALLDAGQASLTQAAAASWQISRLPATINPPSTVHGTNDNSTEDNGTEDNGTGTGDLRDGVGGAPDDPGDPEAAWAGLWQAGDVHAAADQLFGSVITNLDAAQLRHLGAQLREAADARERAAEDYSDYHKRSLRISRSLHDASEITGRLHADGSDLVLSVFEELGGKSGPDDTRTKDQRWADVLLYLAATARGGQVAPVGQQGTTETAGPKDTGGPEDTAAGQDTGWAGEPGDAEPCEDDGHGPGAPRRKRRATGPTEAGGPAGPAGVVPAAYRRPRVIVTVSLPALLRQPLSPGGTLASGTPVTAETSRRVACDAEIIRIITSPPGPSHTGPGATGPPGPGAPLGYLPGADPATRTGTATQQLTALLTEAIRQLPPPLATPSAILDAGRAHRGWTPRQRDALTTQYGGRCAHPGCRSRAVIIHHIIHWADGGTTTITNGVPLCLHHHWLVHEGGWRLRKNPDATITAIPPPPLWQPGTIYRNGTPQAA